MHPMNADLYAVLLVVAVVLSIVAVVQSGLRSLLAWACVLGFFALAWDAAAWAGWFR